MNIREKIAAKLAAKKAKTETAAVETAATRGPINWIKTGTQKGKPPYEAPSSATTSVIARHFKALVLAKAPKAKVKFALGMATPWYAVYLIVTNVDDAFADKLKLKDSYNIKGVNLIAQPEVLDPDDEGSNVYRKLGASPNDTVIAIYLETKEMAEPSKTAAKTSVTKKPAKAVTKSTNKAPAKKAATAKPAATKATAPKGTGKLKAFMKENGIDLKQLKALVKHITPSK